jgi:CRISPR-associated protein Cmr5
MADLQSLDQRRAAYAWTAVGDSPPSEYTNLAKGAPALIMSNGLMQTLAFYKSKKSKGHDKLLGNILGWLATSPMPAVLNSAGFDKAMAELHGGNSDLYMRATEEALEILRWIRQFAAARSKKDSKKEG